MADPLIHVYDVTKDRGGPRTSLMLCGHKYRDTVEDDATVFNILENNHVYWITTRFLRCCSTGAYAHIDDIVKATKKLDKYGCDECVRVLRMLEIERAL